MPQTFSTLTLSNLLTATAALAAVLLLIWLSGRAARASGLAANRPGQRLQLRAALALDGKRRLHLVACDGRELLLLTGGTTELMVGWVPPLPDPLAATPERVP